jgi:hypothetical protein
MLDCCIRQRQRQVIRYAATATILPFRQAGDRASPDCLEFAQTPHGWRRRGPRARLEQFSVFADMHGIDLIGLVAPQLRTREVADLSGIDDAHDMPSLMEGKRDAEAVASGCLQTGMNLSDLVLAEPGNQLMPAIGRIGEALVLTETGSRSALRVRADVKSTALEDFLCNICISPCRIRAEADLERGFVTRSSA